MSGAWSKGANKAVATPPSSLQQAAGAPSGRRSSTSSINSNGGNRRGGGGRGGGGGGGRRDFRDRDSDGFGGRGAGRGGGGGRRDFRDSSGGRGGRGRGGGRGARRSSYDADNNGGGRGNRRSSYDADNNGGGRGNRRSSYEGNNNNGGGRSNRRDSNSRGGGRGNRRSSMRELMKDIQLLDAGAGKTPAQRSVKRISARVFMTVRMRYIEPLPDFQPHDECHWTDDDRLEILKLSGMKAIELGDVSKEKPNKNKDTAPPLESCKPLQVNEDTRWKPKIMKEGEDEEEVKEGEEDVEEIVSKALLILNKVSWTTVGKFSTTFMEVTNLAENKEVRAKVIEILVQKSQMEHHFGPLYAKLCANIAFQVKPFKKELLYHCQDEFTTDTATKIAERTKDVTDTEEIAYHSGLIRKAYIGHMKFLGELYMLDVFKLKNMMECLKILLKDAANEENIECFAHLMTTMGQKLDDHAKQNNQPFDWNRVHDVKASSTISKRTQFLLQDLLELKQRGWISRRKEEKARSLDEIHDEIAQEEQKAAGSSIKSMRRPSQSSLRRVTSVPNAPAMDNDGFTEITPRTLKKVHSKGSSLSNMASLPFNAKGMRQPMMKRSQSQPISLSSDIPSPAGGSKPKVTVAVKTLDECKKKMKSTLKEFFFVGDTKDAMLNIQDLIMADHEGSDAREKQIMQTAFFFVMEAKKGDLPKFFTLLRECVPKLAPATIPNALQDPLEFLNDIELDAPLARSHLAQIVGELITLNVIQMDILTKNSPDYFREESKAATFACKVLKSMKDRDPTPEDIAIVESLKTEKDGDATAQELIAAAVL